AIGWRSDGCSSHWRPSGRGNLTRCPPGRAARWRVAPTTASTIATIFCLSSGPRARATRGARGEWRAASDRGEGGGGAPSARRAVMMTNAADDREGVARIAAFRQGLRELGWTEGQNLRIDLHWAGGDVQRIHANAAEVAATAPDLAVANGSVNLAALIEVAR